MPKTVDAIDQRQFEQWADAWWDPDGPFMPLHRLNEFRCAWLLDRIGGGGELPLKGRRVLDVGCGGGLASEAMARAGATVVGLDVTARSIEVARHHAQQSGVDVTYFCCTVEAHLDANPVPYDLVLNLEVVEHVSDLPAFLSACAKLTRSRGHQVIATINRNPIAGLTTIWAAENLLDILPKGTHQYSKLVKPRELKQLLARDGFDDFIQAGVFYNPFTKTVKQSWHSLMNYLVVAQRA
ncbi:bifunctional 2-polyprenyl-6-hydroxyphenol methylase/3-demethylubiquinol 3-O-methyltransferase UbiG [Litorivicinus lipolyticus]|uniref:bifunctional 2-polyprenyl-6-hydroxyphenol methylase/3-demethylubiquinol 3-O-methyltransferase UbiG n=1 Tax=Litorivicinus lipolyticus TaxID=418701 RepID=UPI003B5B948A